MREECPINRKVLNSFKDPKSNTLFEAMEFTRKPEFEAWFQRYQTKRKKLIRINATLNKAELVVAHTKLDMGDIKHLFDGNRKSFVRSAAINPLELRVSMSRRNIRRIELITSHRDFVRIDVMTLDGARKTKWNKLQNIPHGIEYVVSIWESNKKNLNADEIRVLIRRTDGDEYAHVHLTELKWD